MHYERTLKITKEGVEIKYTYYVVKKYSNDFKCDMYNVGIVCENERKEISDFSPDENEAIRLCDYLYKENVSVNNLFSQSEEFIVRL